MEALSKLTEVLARLPGVGRRSAERMALTLARDPAGLLNELRQSLQDLKDHVTICAGCGSVTSTDRNPCALCADPRREDRLLCVVEDSGDILLIERSGEYKGRYFALLGKLSPMRREGLRQLRLEDLTACIQKRGVREVLLALNSDVESEATAAYLAHVLAQRCPGLGISRLALGIPAGSAIAYSDPVTLARAIRGRIHVENAPPAQAR